LARLRRHSHMEITVIYDIFDSRFGEILICSDGQALHGLYFLGQKYQALVQPDWQACPEHALLRETKAQFAAYQQRALSSFELPLDPQGTVFQKRVWTSLLSIASGQTMSYGAVAEVAANKAAVRAVGAAIGRNPISVIIPCHRVLGSSGALTGYAGGLARKAALLEHEGVRLESRHETGDLFA
jgi:methylated-DNA-[protein]-cysteine S-methyltransferase